MKNLKSNKMSLLNP